MRIRYTGFGNRILQPFVWCQENDFTVEVEDLERAAELLTYPGGQFVAVDPKDEQEVVSFVEGDARPANEIKRRRRKSPSKSKPGGRSAQDK